MRGQELIEEVAAETTETVSGFVDRSARRDAAPAEDLRVRNFDATARRVDVRVTDPDGDTVFERTYHLPPETTACAVNELEDGAYDVAATLDGRRHAIGRCRVDDGPDHTILVETGNGVLNVTEGGN